jgi:hypothetical protein
MTKILRRVATFAAVAAASAGLLLSSSGAAHADAYTSPYLTCEYGANSINPPLTAPTPVLTALYYRVNGGQWVINYTFTSGTDTWKWAYGQWHLTDMAGGSYAIFNDGRVEGWAYSWYYYGGQYHAAGWTNLGTC